jgi:hypothetical protein
VRQREVGCCLNLASGKKNFINTPLSTSGCFLNEFWDVANLKKKARYVMDLYYVNQQAQANGDHEVHKSDCDYMPSPEDRQYLSYFSNCHDAVQEAKKYYPQSNGCYYCSNECHTT